MDCHDEHEFAGPVRYGMFYSHGHEDTSGMSSVVVRLSEPHSHGYGSESGHRRWITYGGPSIFPVNSTSTGWVYQNILTDSIRGGLCDYPPPEDPEYNMGTHVTLLVVVLIRRVAPEGIPRKKRYYSLLYSGQTKYE